MADTAFDFMHIWTQGDEESERKMKTVLLDGLDAVVQAESDVLARMKVARPVASPVVRWLEEWGYPSQVFAQLSGDTLCFTGNQFGRSVNSESLRKVIREGTILERPGDGCQVKATSLDGLVASVTAYGKTFSECPSY